MLKDTKSSDSMLCLEEESSYAKRVGKKKGENEMENLPLCYTMLEEKKIILFRSPAQMLIFA